MTYLDWVIGNTSTAWWHDSAEAHELDCGLARGAIGVTTNPYLCNLAVRKDRDLWADEITRALALPAEEKAEALSRVAVTHAVEKLRATGRPGYVCAQVNPLRAGDRDAMLAMARRAHAWAPQIAVKLPATAAGLDVLEECAATGITVAATVSFTVPQCIAIAQRHRAGIRRAEAAGITPGDCFAVVMIGRLDDYLREVAHDNRAQVSEADIRQAGLAVTKRAYSIYRECGYKAVLLVAALRGAHHLTELAGGELVMSIAPAFQKVFVEQDFPREERIAQPVPADVIERLRAMPEFVRAYEPEGMQPCEFVSYGVTQRTLSQFCEVGWKLMEGLA